MKHSLNSKHLLPWNYGNLGFKRRNSHRLKDVDTTQFMSLVKQTAVTQSVARSSKQLSQIKVSLGQPKSSFKSLDRLPVWYSCNLQLSDNVFLYLSSAFNLWSYIRVTNYAVSTSSLLCQLCVDARVLWSLLNHFFGAFSANVLSYRYKTGNNWCESLSLTNEMEKL